MPIDWSGKTSPRARIRGVFGKLEPFRKDFGKRCALRLIVPDDLIDIVREASEGRELYDDLWSESDLPRELNDLLKGRFDANA